MIAKVLAQVGVAADDVDGVGSDGVLSRIDARRQLIVDQANEGNTGNSRDFWSKSDSQRFGNLFDIEHLGIEFPKLSNREFP